MNYLRITLTAVLPVVCFLYNIYLLSAEGPTTSLSFPQPLPKKISAEIKEYPDAISSELNNLERYEKKNRTWKRTSLSYSVIFQQSLGKSLRTV